MNEPIPTPLSEQIRCLRREISKRNWVYPKLVTQGKITRDKAETEIAQMEAAMKTLEELAASRAIDPKVKGDQMKLI